MGRNVEIKARVDDPKEIAERVRSIADQGPDALRQIDTFFRCPNGRLKLRRLRESHRDGSAELIFYRRPDTVEPEESHYVLAPTNAAASLEAALTGALGTRGEVRKKRLLYLAGQTRIHLDEVEGLGAFLELEVVLEENQTPEDGLRIARELMKVLKIPAENLVAEAYIDLLERL